VRVELELFDSLVTLRAHHDSVGSVQVCLSLRLLDDSLTPVAEPVDARARDRVHGVRGHGDLLAARLARLEVHALDVCLAGLKATDRAACEFLGRLFLLQLLFFLVIVPVLYV
jgi:hypothetical protein